MIERAYGAGQVPTGDGWASELGHGWFNVAYRIRLRDGTEVVLKIAPPPHVEVMTYERGAMSIELTTLDLLRTHTSVPVPVVDFADQSHELCDADYFFMPYIEADNLGIIAKTLPRPSATRTWNSSAPPTERSTPSAARRSGPWPGPAIRAGAGSSPA